METVLQKALEAITSRTNLSTGLAHPNDEYAAKEMFKRLHASGITLRANEISSWAHMNGWGKKDADELGALAQQIGMGKRVKIKDGPWWEKDILERIIRD
ncbi:DUF1889 family protein [Desulfonatronum lacustre]|uniref:DUF1889 family protein n=1 Tax=Desulfonatronum lacustre TaxID=66849 RepID=UPI00048DF876|nr:DUF1889 family protein [Desulfonatronum lacustre]